MSLTTDAIRQAVRDLKIGLIVDKAAVALAQTGSIDLFQAKGGKVLVVSLYSEVTTIIQVQANAAKYILHPASGTDVDACATLDITGMEVGAFMAITGKFADAAVKSLAGGFAFQLQPFVIPADCIIRQNCAANNTGQMKHRLSYLPLDGGAYVAAL